MSRNDEDMLAAHNVSRFYSSIAALSEVSMEVRAGSIHAIIGPSGSGKSTLHRILCGLEAADTGKVLFDGRAIGLSGDVDGESIWPRVTAVFQHQFLWPHLTLRENISLPLRKLSASQFEKRIEECTLLFDMHEFIDRYPNETSGGQRQRAALARAFALNPEFILLDEATTSLDVAQVSVLAQYLTVLKNQGIGISVVTHSLDFVRRCADMILVLDNGIAVETGSLGILDDPKSTVLNQIIGQSRTIGV